MKKTFQSNSNIYFLIFVKWNFRFRSQREPKATIFTLAQKIGAEADDQE